jgi:restriction endonuclease S subunit
MLKYKLGDIATIKISNVDKKTVNTERKVRLCNFIDVYHNWAITREMKSLFLIASANEDEIKKFTIRKGQVAITKDSETRDDIGISTYVADDLNDVLLGYHCALITPCPLKLYGKYLNTFFHSKYMHKYFEFNATGSGQRYSLSQQVLNDIPVILPDLNVQEDIGDFFSLFDRKIALNKAINHNLEAMAKQLYDYWFVQFDFPNEDGKPISQVVRMEARLIGKY